MSDDGGWFVMWLYDEGIEGDDLRRAPRRISQRYRYQPLSIYLRLSKQGERAA